MEKKKSSTLFWVGVASSAAILASAGYYLYTSLFGDEEILEERQDKINELKKEFEKAKSVLNVELAIKVITEINRLSEEIYKRTYPGLDEKRRASVEEPEEYDKICQEVIERRDEAYLTSMNTVLSSFDNKITFLDIQKVLGNINPAVLDQLSYKYAHPEFERPYPNDITIKEAYIFFGTTIQNEMRLFQAFISSLEKIEGKEELLTFKLLVLKIKVDDKIYLKYQITEQQLRFLVYERNLYNDQDIKMCQSIISRFDEMFTGGDPSASSSQS